MILDVIYILSGAAAVFSLLSFVLAVVNLYMKGD